MVQALAQADVERLLADPSVDTRAALASKLGAAFEAGSLTASERQLAEDIFRALTHDAAARVRRALALHVKDSDALPHDVALALARDVDSVALPVLEHSAVLTDQDLIDIIRHGNGAKHVAVAGRRALSAGLADALVERADAAAMARLVGNEGAQLGEELLFRIVASHGEDARVQEPLAARRSLPIAVLERLVALASETLHAVLAKRSDLPPGLASDLVLSIREHATAGLLSTDAPPGEAEHLARQLNAAGRLTASLILHTVCLGDLAFLEAAFAELASIPVHNARLLVHDPGRLGFAKLFARSGLPSELYPAFRVAVDVARETPFDGGENDRERHRRRTLERILTQFEDIGADSLDYLLAKLRPAAATAAAA
ncbi:MAG: DUF2336 domain-containing protein [Alphaproteobacteria bacterium]|nr:DUF2336 domain-containing protein [Alphaproteobacteria bacterium]